MSQQEAELLLQQIEQLRELLLMLHGSAEGMEAFEKQYHTSITRMLVMVDQLLEQARPAITQHGNFIYTGPHPISKK